jgi:hypothetical protein
MKIKYDFMTNSSSSSFIVAFEKKIVKFEDVEFLISRKDKAKQILKDSLSQKPKKINPKNKSLLNYVVKELIYGYMGPDYSDFQDKFCKREGISSNELYKHRAWTKAFYEEYDSIKKKDCLKLAVDFLNKNEGKYLYIFHYGDEDGEFFGEMEHGYTFARLPHITISKH